MRLCRSPASFAVLAAAFCALTPAGPLAHAQAVPSSPAPVLAQGGASQPVPTRGRLLYETHCIACHNSQMHWRDGRIVRDWAGLVGQVRQWQARASLQWTEADILEVARHLNAAVYRLPRPGPA